MLTECSSHLTDEKFTDLSRHLEHTDTKTALAAEAELAILWAISRVAHIVSEPTLPHSTRRPEAYSNDLFESGSAVIEVRALSDDSFSGMEAMVRTANIIAGYADQIRKRAGKHLNFEYMERSYWTTRYHRKRCVDPHFRLTVEMKAQLREWLTAPDWPYYTTSIRIARGTTDVIVRCMELPMRRPRTFCSMPPLAYDLEANPIYKALKTKAGQVRGAAEGAWRCVFLVDTGCNLLRHLRTRVGSINEISGEAIIHHVLAKLSIDVVIELSPYRQQEGRSFLGPSKMVWNVSSFDRREGMPSGEYHRINQMAEQLPMPRFEGYQARALHAQGSFARERNKWYLPATTTLNGETMTIRLSAGLLHEYLAGRIDADRFRQRAFNDANNYFELELIRGNSILQAQFESGGLDEDDDYVVFVLDADPEQIARKQPSAGMSSRDG
jgi:hypothetical protein